MKTAIELLGHKEVVNGLYEGTCGSDIKAFYEKVGRRGNVVKENEYIEDKSLVDDMIRIYKEWFMNLNCNDTSKVNNYLNNAVVTNMLNECYPISVEDLIGSIASCNNCKRKERSEKMNFGLENMLGKFMPSHIGDDEVGLSLSGDIAYRRKNGDYVYYNPLNETIENCMEMVIGSNEIGKMVFVMPTNKVEIGDVIQNGDNYVYITQVDPVIKGVSLNSGRKTTIVKENNLIAQGSLYRKVTSLFTMMNGKDGTGFNPMFLAMLSDSDEENDLFSLLAMSQMMGGNLNSNEGANGSTFGKMNPMMMLMLGKSGDGKMGDMMKLMMMSQMFGN